MYTHINYIYTYSKANCVSSSGVGLGRFSLPPSRFKGEGFANAVVFRFDNETACVVLGILDVSSLSPSGLQGWLDAFAPDSVFVFTHAYVVLRFLALLHGVLRRCGRKHWLGQAGIYCRCTTHSFQALLRPVLAQAICLHMLPGILY
jgi:hypothetical protein